MNISDEAVETVAMIVYRTSGRKRVMSYEQARPTCMDEAREILEAAAPYMQAVTYPHASGDVTVIGPECFTDGETICYKGVNYKAAK